MTAPVLSGYGQIETALFCRIYSSTFGALRFSSYNRPVTIDGESYTALGTLLNVTDVQSDIRPASGTLSITLSGIPNSSIAEILSLNIKGSDVQIWRMFFNAQTHQKLNITGNPFGRFQGRVDNYSLEEEYNSSARTASNTMVFTCTSIIDVLTNKIAGRRTNPTDQKQFFPTDLSMDRVLSLANSNINFGAPG